MLVKLTPVKVVRTFFFFESSSSAASDMLKLSDSNLLVETMEDDDSFSFRFNPLDAAPPDVELSPEMLK
jgi:hypothetical protein